MPASIDFADYIARFMVLFVSFPVHELAHAVTATFFGDDTPRLDGRLTLNPLKHIDLMGGLFLLLAGFGWAKPVQINPYLLYRKSKWAPLLVSLAGPLSNMGLAILVAIPVKAGIITVNMATGSTFTIFELLTAFVYINILLMFFNLLPVAPLDGEKVLYDLLPAAGKDVLLKIRPYGSIILITLIFLGPYIGLDIMRWIIINPSIWITRWLLF
ncbi:MAG: site-2 protease family protein [Anaerolineales bacterium]|nr:site-2 protease family protein [Anaerolineales bacterium]